MSDNRRSQDTVLLCGLAVAIATMALVVAVVLSSDFGMKIPFAIIIGLFGIGALVDLIKLLNK